MAAYYSSAIIPARTKHPRDKPSVENELWQATNEIIATLRNEVFGDFNVLRKAVAKVLESHNERPFLKREGSRKQIFLEEEKALLRHLPPKDYEVCTWVYARKIQKNCHVACRHNSIR